MKSYNELIRFRTFQERFNYLKLHGEVGIDTFGPDRWINQTFYRSKEWRDIRNRVIIRDEGCDLGVPECTIGDRIYIHHINPITVDDFENHPEALLDLNNLICVSFETHQAIHFGSSDYLKISGLEERKPNDTKVW